MYSLCYLFWQKRHPNYCPSNTWQSHSLSHLLSEHFHSPTTQHDTLCRKTVECEMPIMLAVSHSKYQQTESHNFRYHYIWSVMRLYESFFDCFWLLSLKGVTMAQGLIKCLPIRGSIQSQPTDQFSLVCEHFLDIYQTWLDGGPFILNWFRLHGPLGGFWNS